MVPQTLLILMKSLNQVFLPLNNTTQVGKTQTEADEYCARLAHAEQEAQAERGELEKEIEEVRKELLGQLAELEPLPEALRRSELLLQEAQDRERSQERHSMELSTTLTDLHMKVATLSCIHTQVSITTIMIYIPCKIQILKKN